MTLGFVGLLPVIFALEPLHRKNGGGEPVRSTVPRDSMLMIWPSSSWRRRRPAPGTADPLEDTAVAPGQSAAVPSQTPSARATGKAGARATARVHAATTAGAAASGHASDGAKQRSSGGTGGRAGGLDGRPTATAG